MTNDSSAPSPIDNLEAGQRSLAGRHRIDRWFVRFCVATAFLSVVILGFLVGCDPRLGFACVGLELR